MKRPLDADPPVRQAKADSPSRSLGDKFRSAFRGLGSGLRSERNFRIHALMAAAVVTAGCLLGASQLDWCLLVLCIAGVLTAEMFNTALEMLARAITTDDHPDVADALDTVDAAVLIVAWAAAIVGAVVLGRRFGAIVGWW